MADLNFRPEFPEIMGVLNVTPDSFSDGGRWNNPEAGIEHAKQMVKDGATIIDIGGEATSPHAGDIVPAEEWDRVKPFIDALVAWRQEPDTPSFLISLDTYHAETARKGIEAGVDIENDVTGGRGDPQMLATIADCGVPYILQHGRGVGRAMNAAAHYDDVTHEVVEELKASLDRALTAGIKEENICLDPGYGFSKIGLQDWQLAAQLREVFSLGYPVMVGVSRKRFLRSLAPDEQDNTLLDVATAVMSSYFAHFPVWCIRVHNVAATRVALDVVKRIRQNQRHD